MRPTDRAVLAVAVALCGLLVWAVGPLIFDDDPVDLGGGIFMLPAGDIVFRWATPPQPMHLPFDPRYD